MSRYWWTQHVACVWPPCCDMLRLVGGCWLNLLAFETCCDWSLNLRPNDRNMPTQHVAILVDATCCAQQCSEMLSWHVAALGCQLRCMPNKKKVCTTFKHNNILTASSKEVALSSGIGHRNQLTAKALERGKIAIAESLNKVLVFA